MLTYSNTRLKLDDERISTLIQAAYHLPFVSMVAQNQKQTLEVVELGSWE